MNTCPTSPKICKPAALIFDQARLDQKQPQAYLQDQMQRDRWLYQHYQAGDPPLLRFYQWQYPSLSIGRFQACSPALIQQAKQANLTLLRRPSGGQAIWHQNDLTFSWIGPPIGTSVLEGHTLLTQAICNGLSRLGLAAQQGQPQLSNKPADFHCFNTLTPADIQCKQGKLVGSAQARCRKALLQQSVLYLDPDRHRYQSLFQQKFQGVGLRELGVNASLTEIIAALSAGFAETLGLAFVSLQNFDDYATFVLANADQSTVGK